MDLLKDASVDGAQFKNLDFSKKEIRFKEVSETTFTHCIFAEAIFQECRFHNCVFNKCDLSMLRVKSSQFSGVQFEECKVIGINWAEASWPKSGFLRLVDFNHCTLNYSSFFGLKLKNIKITECVAREADFGEADLTGATFDGTDLSGSIFMHTNLTEADFSGATSYTISAKNNVLKKTKFSLPEAISLLYSLDIVLVNSPK